MARYILIDNCSPTRGTETMSVYIIYPAVGHELTEPAFRGRVYDTASGVILDAAKTLAAYDAGTLAARRVVPNSLPHPSYGTREPDLGNYDIRDGGEAEMTRAELAALFDIRDGGAKGGPRRYGIRCGSPDTAAARRQ